MILLLTACTIIEGDGVAASESRDVAGVAGLSAETFVDVVVTPAEQASAELFCDQNLLEHVITELDDGVLRVRTSPELILDPRLDCVLELQAPCLRSLASSGSGLVSSTDVLCSTESLHSSGSGGVSLVGVSSERLELHGSGSGALDAGQLDVGSVDAHFSGIGGGSGGVELTVTESANVSTSGSGDVDLWGGASVVADSSGSGDVTVH